MRIALVISSLQTGGAERVASELANFWSSRGDAVSLITLCAPGTPSLYRLDSRVCWHQLAQATAEGTNFFLRLKKLVGRILALRKALKAIQPEVVVSFVDVMNITTILASLGLKIPVVVSERIHPAYHPLPWVFKKLRRLTYLKAYKVITQTMSASNYFSWLPNYKKEVIPNHVKKPILQKKNANICNSAKDIISIGRLCKQKDFSTLISSFSKVIRLNKNLKLIIYGEGAERVALEKLIKERDLTKHVFLPGEIVNVELALYHADIFVLPSRYEGFPNALCEAMAVGLPVIASRCSGTVDIIRDGVDGRLFPVGDQDHLEMLLEDLINDPTQRVNLSQGALTLPDRFNEASVWKKWDEVLQDARKPR